jgi:signal transduction histidine kinase
MKKLFLPKEEIFLASDHSPWLSPPVATKKASTIKPTIDMTIATKKPAPAIKLKELLAAKERLEELKQQQAVAREEELRIREYLARKLHDGVEGSKTITVDGVKCTITRNLTRTIGVEEAEKLSKEHSDLALECLRWKAEVKVGAYKKHTDILDDYIVTKAGPPSVEFK